MEKDLKWYFLFFGWKETNVQSNSDERKAGRQERKGKNLVLIIHSITQFRNHKVAIYY